MPEDPTVTILLTVKPSGQCSIKCCPPDGVHLPTVSSSAESIPEALANLAEFMEDWLEDNDNDDVEGVFEEDGD